MTEQSTIDTLSQLIILYICTDAPMSSHNQIYRRAKTIDRTLTFVAVPYSVKIHVVVVVIEEHET